MEEKPFRILLDFTELNLDLSFVKYVWMNVCPRNLRTIEDFKNAILKKFPFIQENVKLFLLDGLLPENERIFILRENDTVKLQVDSLNQSSIDCGGSSNDLELTNQENNQGETSTLNLKDSRKRKSESYLTSSHDDNSSEKPSKKRNKSSKTSKFFEPLIIDISSSAAVEEDQIPIQLNHQHFQEALEEDSYIPQNTENSSKKKRKDKSTKISKFYDPVLVGHSSSAGIENEQSYEQYTSQNVHVANENESNISYPTEKQKKKKSKNSLSRMSICDFITYAAAISGLENNDERARKLNLGVSNENVSCVENCNDSSKITSVENCDDSSKITSVENCDGSSKITNIEALDKSETGESVETKKRRRKRKRKRKVELESCLTNNVQTSVDEVKFENGVGSKTNYSSETRKHVLYHSPTPPIIQESEILDSNPNIVHIESSLEEESKVVDNSNSFQNKSLQDNYYKEETYSPVSSLNKTDASIKISTPYSMKTLKAQPWEITPMPKSCSTDSNLFSGEELNNSKKENIKPVYDQCPSLNSLPPIGTRLAFKTLELSDNYCPEVTEFKEGILKSVDPKTDELEIELIEEEIKPGRIGKFELLKEDEIPLPQIIKMVQLKWKDLIDPRLVYY